MYKTPTWQRKAGQNPEGGLNEAGRKSLRAAGHDIKRPQPEGGARKKSFCARMRGAKKHNTSAETANDPDSRINKSLRKWKCADGGEVVVDNALRMARGRPDEGGQEQFLREQLAGSAPQYDPQAGLETAKEAGRMAATMTTPGAIAEAAGYMGTPSALHNIREGNYGAAAMQVAGALPGIGPLAKAAKIAEEARALKSVAPATRVEFPKPDPALLTVHNVRSHRLPMAERLGGAPVPSLAIINPEHGFKSFGDITMVGSPEMARPSRLNPVFASDVYSPRFPSIEDDGERIFRGFTPSGNRKYAPLTMENVVREMKGNVRGGENYNYGAGNVRASVTPQFKSLKEIQGARNKIISEEKFGPLKEQSNNMLFELAEKFYPYSKYSNSPFGHASIFAETLSDVGKGRKSAFAQDYENLPEELKQEAINYLKYLRDMPTEYFEAKPQRAVGYGEFEGAIVPQDILEEVSPALKRLGTKEIIPYNREETGAQQRALELFKPQFFADGGDVTVDNALRMARNMGGGALYNQLNYALNSPTPANPPQDPGPQQPYYQSLPQTRDMIQQYGSPAPQAPSSSPVRQPMPYAKGGKAVWEKSRPKDLGKSKPLSPSQKASAKAAAKAAGRPYPNLIDNMRAARKATQG